MQVRLHPKHLAELGLNYGGDPELQGAVPAAMPQQPLLRRSGRLYETFQAACREPTAELDQLAAKPRMLVQTGHRL